MKSYKTKSEKIEKKQTKLEWTQDAWKDLNSKIYKLFNGTISNLRYETSYSKKTTDISNSSVPLLIVKFTVTGTSDINLVSAPNLSKTSLLT